MVPLWACGLLVLDLSLDRLSLALLLKDRGELIEPMVELLSVLDALLLERFQI